MRRGHSWRCLPSVIRRSTEECQLTARSRADIDLESREWRVAVEWMEHTREYWVPGLINSKTEEKVE